MTIDVHNLLKPPSFFHSTSRLTIRGPRILHDLLGTHFFARFVLFHYENFVYVRAHVRLSINLIILSTDFSLSDTEEGWLRAAAE